MGIDKFQRKLLLTTFWLLVLTLFFLNPYNKILVNQALGMLLLFTGLFPLWRWLLNPASDSIPVLGMMGFFYAVAYGFAGLVTPDYYLGGIVVSESDYQLALIAALISFSTLALGFRIMKKNRERWLPNAFRKLSHHHDIFVLVFAFPLSFIMDQVVGILDIDFLRQSTKALHIFFLIWILHAAWRSSFSSLANYLVIFVYLPVDFILYSDIAGIKLAGLLIFFQLFGLTYVATKGRIPFQSMVVLAGFLLLLQPVKSEYRALVWPGHSNLGQIETITNFVDRGLNYYLTSSGVPFSESLNKTYTRVNHLHVTAAVIRDTPTVQEFRNGQTYMPLFTKWIPRFIWPSKPVENLGNRWAREYGYLHTRNYLTSFNLPWLPEMYINYGWWGVVVISFFVGVLSSLIWSIFAFSNSNSSPIFSMGLLLLSSFFWPESNLSIAVGNLIINTIIFVSVTWLIALLVYIPRRSPIFE